MSPDAYLHFASLSAGYFVKVALAYLLCLLLAKLVSGPRQRFVIWMSFMLGSAAYWTYALASSYPAITESSPQISSIARRFPAVTHRFLIPARFERATVILGRILICTYVVGVLLLLWAEVWKRVRLHFLLKHGTEPSRELRHLFAQMCRQFRIRNCELLILPKMNSPATVCWWRPRVVLPEICEQFGDDTLMGDILYHELAHVARRDYLWSCLNDLFCALLFFHPCVWQAKKQMQIQREMACDLAVVAARPEHRADYAHTLTRVARLCLPRRYQAIGIDFASAPSLLTHRIHAILSDPEKNSFIKALFQAIAGLALIGVYSFLCTTVAVAVNFAPSNRIQSPKAPSQVAQIQPEHRNLPHKVQRESKSPSNAEGLITESPAYRLKSANGSYVASEPVSSGEPTEANDTRRLGWTGQLSGPRTRTPSGQTVGSVIAAVASVIVSDREEHERRSKSVNHLQSPSAGETAMPVSH